MARFTQSLAVMAATVEPAAESHLSVLVAEDDGAFRETVAAALEAAGHVPLEAESGAEALELAASDVPIDVLLTDVVMPGLSGNDLAERIHDRRPGLPVIFMSGYAERDLHRRGLLPPGVPLLQKPFQLAELRTRVQACASHDGEDEGERER